MGAAIAVKTRGTYISDRNQTLLGHNNVKIRLCLDTEKCTEEEVAIENLVPCHLDDLELGEGSQSYQQWSRKRKEATVTKQI